MAPILPPKGLPRSQFSLTKDSGLGPCLGLRLVVSPGIGAGLGPGLCLNSGLVCAWSRGPHIDSDIGPVLGTALRPGPSLGPGLGPSLGYCLGPCLVLVHVLF